MNARRTRRIEGPPPTLSSDPVAVRLLELLTRSDGAQTVERLRAHGIAAPGQAVYELQIGGYEIDRVTVRDESGRTATGYRLRVSASAAPAAAAPTADRARQRDSSAHVGRPRRTGRPVAARPNRSRSQAAARPR